MRPHLLPVVERAARFALNRRGFASRTVTTKVGTLHAFDAPGQGPIPTMVVLHGIGSAATSFGQLLTLLRPHARRVVAPDLPGHGFSDPPRVRLTPEVLFAAASEALSELVAEDEPMVLIGNSLGGAIALRYAIENPGRVVALVLISPAGAHMSLAEWEELVSAFKITSAADARRLLARLYHRPPWYMPAVAPSFCDVMKRQAVRDVLETATPADWLGPDRLGTLSMPVLLLWGQSERVLPSSALEYFRAGGVRALSSLRRPAPVGRAHRELRGREHQCARSRAKGRWGARLESPCSPVPKWNLTRRSKQRRIAT
jgi:pimeloyl-ACP methyl ester carboxylesterase